MTIDKNNAKKTLRLFILILVALGGVISSMVTLELTPLVYAAVIGFLVLRFIPVKAQTQSSEMTKEIDKTPEPLPEMVIPSTPKMDNRKRILFRYILIALIAGFAIYNLEGSISSAIWVFVVVFGYLGYRYFYRNIL